MVEVQAFERDSVAFIKSVYGTIEGHDVFDITGTGDHISYGFIRYIEFFRSDGKCNEGRIPDRYDVSGKLQNG